MRTHQYVDGLGEYCGRCNAPKQSRFHAVSEIPPEDVGLDDEAQLIDRVLRHMISKGEPFSANDFRQYLRGVTRKNLIGDRVKAFAKARLIRFSGQYVASTDSRTHGHPIKIWQPIKPKENSNVETQ